MPTYLNPATSGTTYKVKNSNGLWVDVRPGENVQSYDDLTDYGFTVSAAAPVGTLNDWTTCNFSGERQDTVTLGASARAIDVSSRLKSGEITVSGEIRVYLQDATVPAAVLQPGDSVSFDETVIRSKITTMVVKGLAKSVADVRIRR